METLIFLITAVLGSNAFTYYVQYCLNKKNKDSEGQELLRKTLAAVTYGTISNEIERLLSKDFATPDERHTLNILFDAYKANGWNGDMDARMEKVYRLRTDKAESGSDTEYFAESRKLQCQNCQSRNSGDRSSSCRSSKTEEKKGEKNERKVS